MIRRLRSSSLKYNVLETRRLLASIQLDSGDLLLVGTAGDDLIDLRGGADFQSFTIQINKDPEFTQTFRYDEVNQLRVFAGEGDDRVTNTLLRESHIYGGLGNDHIEGGYRDDLLLGGEGVDTLIGRNGDDVLYGQGGNDWLYGGQGEDRLLGSAGNDRLFGGNGSDFLAGQEGNDQIIGGAGNDRLDGNNGNDLLNGNEGDDTLYAGEGNDTVNGGIGDDVIAGGGGDDALNGNGGDDEIYGGSGSDNLFGGSGDDYLAGQNDNDVLDGGWGDDRLLGNSGNDTINGNDGNDTIKAGVGDDTVNGGPGDDLIFGVNGLNFLYGNGGSDHIHGGSSNDHIDGGSEDDFLYGNAGRDRIFGGTGVDELFGGVEGDFLKGDEGNDRLYGQAGNDVLVGDQGRDLIFGNEGDDEIHASSGNDKINGNSGSDLVYYLSDQEDFDVVSVGANYQIADLRAPDPSRTHGVDLLIGIEELSFGEPGAGSKFAIEATLSRSAILSSINQVLSDGWRSRFRIVGDDIWVRTVKPDGTPEFDFRLGAAGVIAEIRDVASGQNLLAPSNRGESTDRVVQWTLWELGQTIRHNVGSLPDFEDRFNLTQAGTFDNVIHGTVEVEIVDGQVNIWSVVDRNWKSQQDPYMDGTVTALTQMTILDGGGLLVRRVVRVGEIRLNRNAVTLDNPYFEAWTPLSDAAFNAMAVSIDGNGNPDEFFIDGRNIPGYQPRISVENTRGWALGYDRFDRDEGTNLAVVFGTDIGTVFSADGSETNNHQYARNSLDFRGGWAILPGLFPGSVGEGAIIETHLILLPGDTIDASTGAQLDALAELLPAPRVFHAGAQLSGDLNSIANRLSTLSSENRTSTDHLAGLL